MASTLSREFASLKPVPSRTATSRVHCGPVQASARSFKPVTVTGLFSGAAAAFVLLASPTQAFQQAPVRYQEVAQLSVNTDDPALGTPGSETRYKPGQPLPGDEEKIREARALLLEEEKTDAARKPGEEYTKTNTFLDPYGRKESSRPGDAGSKF